MAKRIGIGYQDFEEIIKRKLCYVDKTYFIKEWWENEDQVTLITRPRRFGKTLTLDMVEKFFSVEYAGCGRLFEGYSIWQEGDYRALQGTYPVVSLTLADVKEGNFREARMKLGQLLTDLYSRNRFLLEGDLLSEGDKNFFGKVSPEMDTYVATMSLKKLSEFLCRYYGKKVILLLDEYDTPMQEAYVAGYWEELAAFTRSLFNSAFKTNPWLERGILTGITRVSKESIFSDLNNLKVVTTTSRLYADCFGFTEQEVFGLLEEYGLAGEKGKVKEWYDGFTFGAVKDIYNPWSILGAMALRLKGRGC